MMVGAVVFLGLLALGATAQESCPMFCDCSLKVYHGGIARCKSLDPKVQKFPPEVTHLIVEDLGEEGHLALTDNIFYDLGLENLKTIRISNSSLREMDKGAFTGLHSLQEVDLSNNKLMLIHPDTFKENIQLQKLRLKGNPLQLTQVLTSESHYFLDSDSLEELDMSYCQLRQFSPDCFSKLTNLEVLILNHNYIQELNKDTFSRLVYLTDVDLSFNEISRVDPATFSELEEMTVLNLRGNRIDTVENGDLPDLTELDVSQCRIKELTAVSLAGVTGVTHLNLSHNLIEKIHPDAFVELFDLTYLYLGHNSLTGPLPEFLLEKNKRLEVLSFTGNKDMKLFNGSAVELPSLYRIDLSDCGLLDVTEESFRGMRELVHVNLSGNSLQFLDGKTFSGLERLEELDMSRNKLHSLPIRIFRNNLQLRKVDLSDNAFRHVSPYLFLAAKKLNWLDLSGCRLTYLWNNSESVGLREENVFQNLVHLRAARNRLTRLDVYHLARMPKLEVLDISDNPFECSSSFGRAVEWLMIHRILPGRVSVYDQISTNQAWSFLIKKVCPIGPVKVKVVTQESLNLISDDSESDSEDDNEQDDDGPEQLIEYVSRQPVAAPSEPCTTDYRDERRIFDWSVVLVMFIGISILIVVANFIVLLICKTRNSYRLVSYKSHFPNPLGGLSQIRHGSNSPHIYHKLYEDCSVPTTPIVKSKGKSVVTCIVNTISKPPESV